MQNVCLRFIVQRVKVTFFCRDAIYSSVSAVAGYGQDDRGSGVRLPAGARNLSLLLRVQTDSGVHLASYTMG